MAKRYGVPYMGSKNKIAQWLIDKLPSSEVFVDLFAGGCAVTHAAIESGKYQEYVVNDIGNAPDIFIDAIHGKYKDETRWISREDFFRLKDVDPYVKYCWSFGNQGNDYLYGKEIEPYKKALHYARVFGDYSLLKAIGINTTDASRKWIKDHDSEIRTALKNGASKSLERLQSLQSLQSLERLERLEIYNLSYEQVKIPVNAVVYCDIPYKSTNSYFSEFDYDKFYNWCRKQQGMIFISEYEMPDDFYLVAEFERCSLLSQHSRKKVSEKLYCNKPYCFKTGGD